MAAERKAAEEWMIMEAQGEGRAYRGKRLALRFVREIPIAGRIEMTRAGWRYSAAREEWSVVVLAETAARREAELDRFSATWNGRRAIAEGPSGAVRAVRSEAS
ncbi:hypothetical protein [Komagataeibacter saccharivorans]|uniref:hypothetical protein n=1 Tax=Komagataeibacter saccharivorans TaxID=265959 RepID=UPI00104F410F|nr:hypothetical protein [Komagataeibacter saccharivorans]